MSFHSLSLIFSLHVDNYGKCVTLWCWRNIFITQFLCSSSYVFLCAGRVLLPATSTDDIKGMSSFNDLKTVEECAKFHEAYQQTGLFLWDCTWQHKTIALTYMNYRSSKLVKRKGTERLPTLDGWWKEHQIDRICRYLQLNYRYLQFNCRHLQFTE